MAPSTKTQGTPDAVLDAAVATGKLVGAAATAWSESGLNYAGAAGMAGSTAMQADTPVGLPR